MSTIAIVIGYVACFAGWAMVFGRIIYDRALAKGAGVTSNTVIAHECAIEDQNVRVTFHCKAAPRRVLVIPAEAAYQMSDDLMRSAAAIAKRQNAQRSGGVVS